MIVKFITFKLINLKSFQFTYMSLNCTFLNNKTTVQNHVDFHGITNFH